MSDVNQKAAKAADEASKRIEAAAGRVAQAAERAAAQAAESASGVSHAVQDAVGRAVSEGYERVSDQARESFDQGRDAARRWERGFESSVQRRPLVSVLIAAAVGALLGILFAKHDRD
ncbi:MAG: hypothetical protein JWM97_1159 [Phycisphaerales bacterium]|nr:hypothetical protein [Phycisphaerales bacterium]